MPEKKSNLFCFVKQVIDIKIGQFELSISGTDVCNPASVTDGPPKTQLIL